MSNDPLASSIRGAVAGAIDGTSDAIFSRIDKKKAAKDLLTPKLPRMHSSPSYHPNWQVEPYAEHKESALLLYVFAKTSSTFVSDLKITPSESSPYVRLVGETEWPIEIEQNDIHYFIVKKGQPEPFNKPHVTFTWRDYDGEEREDHFEISITGSSWLDALYQGV